MDITLLTADEIAEVRAFEDMFATEGWKRFIEKHKEAVDVLPKRAIAAKDEKELFMLKGQFAIMSQLINYQEFYLSSIEGLIQERQIEADRLVEDAAEEGVSRASGF